MIFIKMEEKDCTKPIQISTASYSDALDLSGVDVPEQISVHVPESQSATNRIIESANEIAGDPEFAIRVRLTDQYIKAENKRLDQQTPLLKKIFVLTCVQIGLFNFVILIITIAVIVKMFLIGDGEFVSFLDFLKYYIGAVLVELLGMLASIAGSVFSSNYNKIIEKVLPASARRSK